MRRTWCGLWLMCCVLVCGAPARAQFSTSGVGVTGLVFADGGAGRLQNVLVRLCDTGGRMILESATSASGEFQFGGLSAAHYVLQFEATGFQDAQVSVDLTFSSQSGMVVYLKPVARTGGAPAGASGSVSAHELAISDEARALYVEGKKKLYTQDKAQEAQQDFERALKISPDFYEARYQLGMTQVRLEKSEDAAKSFRKCIDDSHDKFGGADIALGTLQVNHGEVAAGEKLIRRGLELSPNAWMGYYQLGKLDALRGNLGEAEKSAEQARTYAPGTAMVYQLLATIHMKQKNYAAMLEDIDAFLRIEPDSPAGKRAAELRDQIQKQMSEEAAKR